jgi:hypothetical protein
VKSIYQFDDDFCNGLISIVDESQCYSLELCRPVDPTIERVQNTNALQFEIPSNLPQNLILNNIIETEIDNVVGIRSVIEIADKTKRYMPYSYQNPYVFIVVLNNTFSGGRASIDSNLVSLNKGELICIYPNEIFNVEAITNGKRYSLISYVDVKIKKNKSVI